MSLPRQPREIRPSASMLPPLLFDLAERIGVDSAVRLARRFGGQRLYIPHEWSTAADLIDVVGTQGARYLCGAYAGNRLDVPSARAYLRWYDARVLRRQGLSNGEIARRLGVNRRQVTELLRGDDLRDTVAAIEPLRRAARAKGRAAPVDLQMDLFG